MTTRKVLLILNFNDFDMCDRLLKKVGSYDAFHKIILVDNQSSDDSYIRLKKAYQDHERIDFIQSRSNKGYATGNNFGACYAIRTYNPQILYIANPDVLFDEPVVEKMANAICQHSDVGIVAPLVIQGYNIWNLPGFWGVIESLFLILFNLDKIRIRRNLQHLDGIQEVGVVEGSLFAVSVKAFEKVGGFDERTFLYYEENILGHKMKQNGYKVTVLPQERYEHLHSQSIRKKYKSKAKAFRLFYPSIRVYLEHYLMATPIQLFIFEIAFQLAYWERNVYDIICKFKIPKTQK